MTSEDLIEENARRIEEVRALISKLNDQANVAREAIQLLKQIGELQSKRLDNLELWNRKLRDELELWIQTVKEGLTADD